jgi:hypothetical protein
MSLNKTRYLSRSQKISSWQALMIFGVQASPAVQAKLALLQFLRSEELGLCRQVDLCAKMVFIAILGVLVFLQQFGLSLCGHCRRTSRNLYILA